MLVQTVRILAITSIRWTSGRFYISYVPWFWTNRTQECHWIQCTCTFFHVIRLYHDTILFRPKLLQGQNHLLEIHDLHSFIIISEQEEEYSKKLSPPTPVVRRRDESCYSRGSTLLDLPHSPYRYLGQILFSRTIVHAPGLPFMSLSVRASTTPGSLAQI
ncbi:hypothetical protein D1872_211630 [compost metagenome]